MPATERRPSLASQDHPLVSEARIVPAGPVPATPQTRGRNRGARHPDPAGHQLCNRAARGKQAAARHPWLRHRSIGSGGGSGGPEASTAAVGAAAEHRPEKRNVPARRGTAHAPLLRPPPPGARAGTTPVPHLRQDHRRRSGNASGSPWQDHSPPRLARPLCRRLSPQTTACPAPAPDAI